MQNANPTLRSESRGQTCLRYAEPQGGKACEAGLMQNAELKNNSQSSILNPQFSIKKANGQWLMAKSKK